MDWPTWVSLYWERLLVNQHYIGFLLIWWHLTNTSRCYLGTHFIKYVSTETWIRWQLCLLDIRWLSNQLQTTAITTRRRIWIATRHLTNRHHGSSVTNIVARLFIWDYGMGKIWSWVVLEVGRNQSEMVAIMVTNSWLGMLYITVR